MGSIKNILIVDDSSTSRFILKKCLSMALPDSFNTYEGADGLEAMFHVTKENIDLIITDINMPVLDGIAFLNKLAENNEYKDTPIIIVSSNAHNGLNSLKQKVNILGYLKKPIEPEHIVQKIESLVEKVCHD